jgi:D-mannonate dehydratase
MAECNMHVGVQGMGTSKIEMEFLRRHGVTHMNAGMADHEVETLVRHKEEAAVFGVSVEATHISLPRSITLAQDPQRDEDIERVCRWIENAGRAGYRALFYNFCILDHQRTAATLGARGREL